jgi:TolB-like protein/Flp pilus assembly protein TadD
MNFVDELKRRNVFRVGIAYAVVGWLLMQVTDTFSPALRLPEWFPSAVAFLLLLGLPIALFFAWAFELTPDGIKRDSDVDPKQSTAPQNARKLDRMIIVALVAVVIVLLLDRYMGDQTPEVAAVPEQPATETATNGELPASSSIVAPADGKTSVAVLPFINMSDDQQNEYFSDGISEELLNVLVRIQELRVPSRTSSFTFKGSEENVVEIGRKLQVDHILEGSVRKAGNRIRVTAQLIDVRSDTHLWSDTYTRELDDIFAVQDEIAKAIVEALKLTLSLGEQQKISSHSTGNIEAYNKYLQGKYLWNKRTVQSLYAAIEILQEATALDPEYSQGWAALADAYMILPEYDFGAGDESIPKARRALEMALELNPESAHALAVSGLLKAQYEFDWDGANADLQKAIELEPGNATAHQWYADILMPQGRVEEAYEQLTLATIADPISVVIRHTPGYFNLWVGRLDEAEKIYMMVLEMDPYFRWTYQNLDMLYTMRGEYDKARHWATRLAEMEGYDPAPDIARIDAVENPALKPRALELLEQRTDIVDGVWGKAMQYALMDEWELALISLEKSFETESPWRVHMNWVVNYKPLQDNPRYQAMLRKMNQLP